jgi:hypothetical protein
MDAIWRLLQALEAGASQEAGAGCRAKAAADVLQGGSAELNGALRSLVALAMLPLYATCFGKILSLATFIAASAPASYFTRQSGRRIRKPMSG